MFNTIFPESSTVEEIIWQNMAQTTDGIKRRGKNGI
jgi:hypothetical protein